MVGLSGMWPPFVTVQAIVRMHMQQMHRRALGRSKEHARENFWDPVSAAVERCSLLDAAMALDANATGRVPGYYARWISVCAASFRMSTDF
jgi:hypothetical protein